MNAPIYQSMVYSQAIENGDLPKVRECLEKKPDLLESLVSTKFSPLSYAVLYKQIHVAELLLDQGADLTKTFDTFEAEDLTALHFAAFKGLAPFCKLFMSRGANLLARNKDGATPLLLACMGDVDIKTEAMASRQLDAVHALLDCGASLNEFDNADTSPLIYACYGAREHVARALLSMGCNIDHSDGNGMTALMHAASKGHLDCALLLLEWGADFSKPDKFGKTPMDHARGGGQTTIQNATVDAIFSAQARQSAHQAIKEMGALNYFRLKDAA